MGGLWLLGTSLGGCATVIEDAVPIGDGTAYVVGSRDALNPEPTVWRCPATAGTQAKCTKVTVTGVER
jgi:hypothetical protein